jgi:secreted trypsin-like serine protease
MAAYYHNGRGDSGFICGGSLISSKLAVTSAHCIHSKGESIRKKAEEATFYFGKNNLDSLNSEQNYEISAVSEFVIHPEWNPNTEQYDADIAIVILTRTIYFTRFVKPICIWTATSTYNDLIGFRGIIAGWGKTEFNAVSTSVPKWTEIPVVDLETCLRSNSFLNTLTSDRTFCAGNQVGNTGPW